MGWIVQAYEGDAHVVPENDELPHMLTGDCDCQPRIELVHASTTPSDPGHRVILHRDQLEREVGIIR
jgi:hypothetical protein